MFVTAYDKYAIQAFEVNAVDYLLKPFDQSHLLASLERVRERLAGSGEALARRLESLIQARATQWPQTLVVRQGERFDLVSVMSVDWIEAANNYAALHCGSVDHVFGETLASLETRLDPARFLRVHRSMIVNTARIVTVHPMIEYQLNGGITAFHCSEIAFAFHALSEPHIRIATGGAPAALALQDKVSQAWVNFARTGNPSQAGPAWKPYTLAKQVQSIGCRRRSSLQARQRYFWLIAGEPPAHPGFT